MRLDNSRINRLALETDRPKILFSAKLRSGIAKVPICHIALPRALTLRSSRVDFVEEPINSFCQ